ncbi:MAG: alpha/beta hydrolase [Cyanobacteria bacterium J06627_8]
MSRYKHATQPNATSLLASSALAMGTSIGIFAMASPTQAIEQVRFVYNGIEVTVSEDEVEQFAETGELPDTLRAFFDQTPQVPEEIRAVLIREFRIPRFVDSFLDSPTGEFALLQIDQAINSSSNRGDLDALRSAFETAGADRDVSFIELVRAYPEDEVRINVSNLEDVYTRTVTFVERIQPAIETAIGFLQDIVCDCDPSEASTADEPSDESSEAGSSADLSYSNCNTSHTESVSEFDTHQSDVESLSTDNALTSEQTSNTESSTVTAELESQADSVPHQQ